MNCMEFERYGYTEFYKSQVDEIISKGNNGELKPARICEVHREQYKILTQTYEKSAKLKSSIFHNVDKEITFPAVGDFVLVKENPLGEDIIFKVLDRKSKFSRMDSFNKKEQVVATNFDYVFIMTSLNYDFNVKRTERYLTAAWQSGATPIIVLTKADLCSDIWDYEKQLKQVATGIPIIPVSSITGVGLEELEAYIQPTKTIVFLGSSGVGKSSLVNAIAKEEVMKVNDIREDDSKGRHTTTHRQLIVLQNGTMIIDTPGMRELEMWDVTEGLNTAFEEVEEMVSKCRFSDCSHRSEPGCYIKEALNSGELTLERWENYNKLKKEAQFAERKESVKARLKEKEREKSISKYQKEIYKRR